MYQTMKTWVTNVSLELQNQNRKQTFENKPKFVSYCYIIIGFHKNQNRLFDDLEKKSRNFCPRTTIYLLGCYIRVVLMEN